MKLKQQIEAAENENDIITENMYALGYVMPKDHHYDFLTLYKGANHTIDEKLLDKELSSSRKKLYSAECASGFYTAEERAIAVEYAYDLAEQFGGTPTLNVYMLDFARMKEEFEQAYFTELNERSMRYVGENLLEVFPEWCPYFGVADGTRPQDVCDTCQELCDRNKQYIEAILSDHVAFNFDELFKNVALGRVSEEEAIKTVNTELEKRGVRIGIQVLLRANVRSYLHFDHAEVLPLRASSRPRKGV